MKKIYLLSLLSVLLICQLSAQDKTTATESVPFVKKNLFAANFLFPGLTYERGIGKESTISATLGTTFSGVYTVELPNGKQKDEYSLNPAINLAYRYYYNFEKRKDKNKNTKYNSANYISLLSHYSGRPLTNNIPKELTDGNYYFCIGPVWGIQRTYTKRFHLNLEIGLGHTQSTDVQYDWEYSSSSPDGIRRYHYMKEHSSFDVIGNFRLGFYLGKM